MNFPSNKIERIIFLVDNYYIHVKDYDTISNFEQKIITIVNQTELNVSVKETPASLLPFKYVNELCARTHMKEVPAYKKFLKKDN